MLLGLDPLSRVCNIKRVKKDKTGSERNGERTGGTKSCMHTNALLNTLILFDTQIPVI